jgi:hypothetical protein
VVAAAATLLLALAARPVLRRIVGHADVAVAETTVAGAVSIPN